MLIEEFDAQVILSWGPDEEVLIGKIRNLMKRHPFIPEKLSLKELAYVIKKSNLFVGGDTGPMHIAALLGTPIVAIFGPKDPQIHGPCSTNQIVVRKDIPCSPCTRRRCKDVQCIKQITPEDVFDACKKLLTV